MIRKARKAFFSEEKKQKTFDSLKVLSDMNVIDHGDGIAGVVFTHSADDNRITSDQIVAFASTLDDVLAWPHLRAIILSGEGRNFCTGRIAAKGLQSAADIRNDLVRILDVNNRLRAASVPFVAAVEGQAFGFGCGLATQCDIAIAAADASFALPEMAHNLPPLVVLSYFGKFVPFKKAFELALTSREFGAAEAAAIGIVTTITEPGTALAGALAAARQIAALDKDSVRLLRRFAREVAGLTDETDARRGIDAMAITIAERNDDGGLQSSPPYGNRSR
jgi:enoyl-CoA hydratase/carnithine racemase